MRVLLDTNILLRSSQPAHPHHSAAVASVAAISKRGDLLCISSQTVYEFLAVCTRDVNDRGLGMSQVEADAQLSKLLGGIDVLYDSAAVIQELRRLTVAHAVKGKSVHDARLVA